MSLGPRHPRHRHAVALGAVLVLLSGCSIGSGTLGGRETCWPEAQHRMPSVWRGILRIDVLGGRLDTPEGEAILLRAGALSTRVGSGGSGELVRGEDVVARAGEDVTLFGGAGSDGTLVVCAVEERHPA